MPKCRFLSPQCAPGPLPDPEAVFSERTGHPALAPHVIRDHGDLGRTEASAVIQPIRLSPFRPVQWADIARRMGTNIGFQQWHYRAESGEISQVFPDGCRDVLIIARRDEPARVILTDFDFRPRNVTLFPGTDITGYRLRPGAAVGQHVLDAIAANRAGAENILGNALNSSDEIDDIIVALTLPGSTVQSISKNLGISVRTMQRRFRDRQLPPPEYWRLLGRARRAVAMLSSSDPLADVAYDSGYSDQAHMTREFTRWFGETPTRLRRDANLFNLLCQPALGNWTGEQISTR